MGKQRESVVLIPVPETEKIASPWREKYDPVALRGVPAHITLLYPFLKPDLIDQRVVDNLSLLFKNFHQFKFVLNEVGTFPQGVIFIRPCPKEPFIDLTQRIEKMFGIPPFEGKYPDINPHLTLANHISVEVFEKLQEEIPTDVEPKLSIEATAREAWLMETDDKGYWRTRVKFDLNSEN